MLELRFAFRSLFRTPVFLVAAVLSLGLAIGGARRSRILSGVLFDAGRLAALGIIVGIPLAIFTTRFIRGLLYSTDPADPVGYVVIAAAVTLVALLAALAPALRASRISPLIAIQAE